MIAWLRNLALLVLLSGLALFPETASAHAVIVSSQPAQGERLSSAPGSVGLRFSEPINTKLSRASVTAPTGERYNGTSAGAKEIQIPLATSALGIYTVNWTSVSLLDGHTLVGSFEFGVGVSPRAAAEEAASPAPRPIDLGVAALRLLEYGGLLAALGMWVLQVTTRRLNLGWMRFPLQPAIAVALFSGVAVVLGEVVAATDTLSLGGITGYLGNGLPGLTRLLRIAAEAIALQASVLSPRYSGPPLMLAAVALAATGHAAATSPAWWSVSADTLHLLSAGVWAGGILALATLRPPGGWLSGDARPLLDRFTPIALTAFAVTVGFGVVRAFQELSALGDLLLSTYGQVLSVKAGLVASMAVLSLLAWRRRLIEPRMEAAFAAAAIGAAALLVAHPLPPGRAREAEAAQEAAGTSTAAFPEAQDLALAATVNETIVGLTLRPGRPGPNTAFLYLLPGDSGAAARGISATLSVGDQTTSAVPCGTACRTAELDLEGGEQLTVRLTGSQTGAAMFDLPSLPAPDAGPLLTEMETRMHTLRTFRLQESLGPIQPPVRATYEFQAPDRIHYEIENGNALIWIGPARYLKEGPTGAWQPEDAGFSLRVPQFIWDVSPAPDFVAPHLLGEESVDGTPTQIVSFFEQSGSQPVWFRLWIDPDGLVRRAQMRAQAHFMDHRYYDFDAPFSIEPPTG